MAEAGAAMAVRKGERTGGARAALRITGLCLFVLYLFLGPVDAQATIDALFGLQPGFWALAWCANLVPPLLIALRLRGLLAARGYEVGYTALARDSLRSMTLNTVAIVGAGDLYRLNRLRSKGVPVGTSGSAVVIDRAFGIGVLVALVALFQVLGRGALVDGLGAGLVATAAIVLLAPFLLIRFGPGNLLRGRVSAFLRRQSMSAPLVARSAALSALTVGAWIVSVYFLGNGLGLSIPLTAYLEAAPLVALASFLPISVGGVGLRETGYVLLLAQYGASPEACVALGIAQYSTLLGVALVGAAFFALPERDSN